MLTRTNFQLMCSLAHQLILCSLVLGSLSQTSLASEQRIHSGLTTAPVDAGSIFAGYAANNAEMICSGALISCDLAITAAHCLHNPGEPDNQYWFYLQHAGMHKVRNDGVELFCDSQPCIEKPGALYDLALIRLKEPAWKFKRTRLKKRSISHIGNSAKFLGFGIYLPMFESYNLKRQALVQLSKCEAPIREEFSFCSSLSEDFPNPCHMDSGGPVYSLTNGKTSELLGIAIRTGISCRIGQSIYNNVSSPAILEWLNKRIIESNRRCGINNQTPMVLFSEHAGWLDRSVQYRELEFEIGNDVKSLLVTMNHSPGPLSAEFYNDFDLKLIGPSGEEVETQSIAPECDNSWLLVSECRMESPSPGRWRASVERINGEGHFQLVASGISK